MSPDFQTHQMQLRGKLLLAQPGMRDPSFRRTVLLICNHEAGEGASGLILNRPLSTVVGELLKDKAFEPLKNVPVYEGGPVLRDQLMFCSMWWTPKRGLHWAMRISIEEATNHLSRPGRIVRAYLGHAGWSPGQLENEMSQQTWICTEPRRQFLGAGQDVELWRGLLGEMSPLHRILAQAPDDPFLN
ncbi:MAG: YqgE/AlgH family protein [Luteolibacter sp.]